MNNSIKSLKYKADKIERLDIFLSEKINFLTRSFIKKMINLGNVIVNDNVVYSASKKLKVNDNISIKLIDDKDKKIKPSKIKLNIKYEDKDILVINKPAGMVVHPGAGNYEDTLANALIHKYKNKLSNINGDLRPGIVHRIDKDTSGLFSCC